MAEACLVLVVVGITAYAVLGGADFGAGLWDLTAGGAERGGRVRGMVQRSMSPVWEANHVWLIFVLVPFFLGAAVGGVASGRVPVGNVAGDPVDSWLNPTGVLIGVLAVLSGAYLAAVFLAGDSVRAGLPDLARAFRARALGAGVVTGVVALAGLLVLRSDARPLYDGLTSGGGLVMVLLSAAAGAVTLWLVATERYGPARLSSAAAVGAITVGWVLAQDPYLLPPELTLGEAAASDATLTTLLVGMAIGALVLVPSLWYLYRLVLQGRLDQAFEPLDQRFRPLEAGDDPEAGRP